MLFRLENNTDGLSHNRSDAPRLQGDSIDGLFATKRGIRDNRKHQRHEQVAHLAPKRGETAIIAHIGPFP